MSNERRARRMCFDRILPRNLHRPGRSREVGGRFRAIGVRRSVWVNGSTITIGFMEGTQDQIGMVQHFAPQWTEHANLNFEFTDDPRANIRITFDDTDGAWSYIGTDNLDIPLHAATLNLGWQDQGVILHEFGHMIGLGHEHSSPLGGIEWNEEVVLRELAGPPNFWDEATVRHNVFRKYSLDQIHGTEFDEDSIMLYEFPEGWVRNRGATHENDELSQLDEQFVRSEKMYPGRPALDDRARDLPLGAATDGALEVHDEEDLFRLEIPKSGRYAIETAGSTDVTLALFGPDSPTALVARDDDGGVGLNARIVAEIEPGTYYIQVRHYDPAGTGAYGIEAREI